MTKSLHRHCTFKTVLERKRRRSGFSAEMQRHEEKVQKWFAVADCSRHEQRRPGRLDRRWWSRVRRIISDEDEAERSRCRASRSAGQQSLSMRYGSANPCRHLYTRTVSLKSIHSRTFSQWSDEEPEWRGRILTMEKSAEQLHSSRIGAAEEDVLGCQQGSSCWSPVKTKQVTTRATGERASTVTDRCSVVDAALQNRLT